MWILYDLYSKITPNSAAVKKMQFNSFQFNNFIPDSTGHIQQIHMTLRSICCLGSVVNFNFICIVISYEMAYLILLVFLMYFLLFGHV